MPTTPSPNQLAVLDWMRRWPLVRLTSKGRWSAQWASEPARLHMAETVVRLEPLLGQIPIPTERRSKTAFDYTPRCGAATLKELLARDCLLVVPGGRRTETEYALSPVGLSILLRYSFRLNGFEPKRASERQRRPVHASAKLLKRYGGPEGAKLSLAFHERQAAYHARIAERLRSSLELYEGSEEQRRDEWVARGRARRRG